MRKIAANSTYTQVGSCFYESEVLNQNSVHLMKFSAVGRLQNLVLREGSSH